MKQPRSLLKVCLAFTAVLYLIAALIVIFSAESNLKHYNDYIQHALVDFQLIDTSYTAKNHSLPPLDTIIDKYGNITGDPQDLLDFAVIGTLECGCCRRSVCTSFSLIALHITYIIT
jgi:hypothetical protein